MCMVRKGLSFYLWMLVVLCKARVRPSSPCWSDISSRSTVNLENVPAAVHSSLKHDFVSIVDEID